MYFLIHINRSGTMFAFSFYISDVSRMITSARNEKRIRPLSLEEKCLSLSPSLSKTFFSICSRYGQPRMGEEAEVTFPALQGRVPLRGWQGQRRKKKNTQKDPSFFPSRKRERWGRGCITIILQEKKEANQGVSTDTTGGNK